MMSLLDEFLNVYWLRPENALWRAVACNALEDVPFEDPSLDLSCGDGIFSFLCAGGEFDRSFDFFDDVDIYDHSSEVYEPEIVGEPE